MLRRSRWEHDSSWGDYYEAEGWDEFDTQACSNVMRPGFMLYPGAGVGINLSSPIYSIHGWITQAFMIKINRARNI